MVWQCEEVLVSIITSTLQKRVGGGAELLVPLGAPANAVVTPLRRLRYFYVPAHCKIHAAARPRCSHKPPKIREKTTTAAPK